MAENLESRIIDLITQKGPLTGAELRASISEDHLRLWQACRQCESLATMRIGTRYMRLDRRIEGYACLSPSILREFLSYSVVGLVDSVEAIQARAYEIDAHTKAVSKQKLELAQTIAASIRNQCGSTWNNDIGVCFIIAGDIVYQMAHDVPRPEQSTGKLVKGSDIDLVVVLEDGAPDDLARCLDDAIYREKYRLLSTPAIREEIDYVVKKMSKVQEQLQFDTFKRMVACKILGEGRLLYGSESFFQEIQISLVNSGAAEKLAALEKNAHVFRERAEKYLLQAAPGEAIKESLYLFYPHEESEEYE
jgi:hypothetical protein